MNDDIETHYAGAEPLATRIEAALTGAGKDIGRLTTAELAAVDEFHIRGRQATLELAGRMELWEGCHVLDLGSGIGGPARTVAETHRCKVTGVDLTRRFCEAAATISGWLGMSDDVRFIQGDATDLAEDLTGCFDAAMTIHAAMNIAAKDALYASAKRALRPGRIFAVYDVVQGEGGAVVFPVPWARDASISHLATPGEMRGLLAGAGFEILDEVDSTEESLAWFRQMAARMARSGPQPLTFQSILGADFPEMAKNQIRNLADKRIRTVTFVCRG